MFPKARINWLQIIWGGVFTTAGVLIILAALRGDPALNIEGSIPLGIFFGLLFLLPGLWALQAHRLWARFTGGDREFWNMVLLGAMVCLIGLFIMVMSVADPDDSNFNAPRWVAGAAGGVFVLAGLVMIKTKAIDSGIPQPHSLFNSVLFALLLSVFGVVASWVSLGPGEREFSSTISLPFISVSTSGNEALGRLCFLPGALLLDGMAAATWFHVAKLLGGRGKRRGDVE